MDEVPGVPADLLGGHPRVLTAAAATGRLPDRDTLDGYRAAGVRAAESGVPLRALVETALLMAESVVPVPLPALRRTISALMEGYENAQRLALRQEEAARREFVDDLLQGRADRLAERAEHFGLRLAETYVVAVARPAGPVSDGPTGGAAGTGGVTAVKDGDGPTRRIEEALVARFGSHNVLVAVRDGGLVCVAPGSLAVATGEFTTTCGRCSRPAGGSGWDGRTGGRAGWSPPTGRPPTPSSSVTGWACGPPCSRPRTCWSSRCFCGTGRLSRTW
ncbi:hypothetical protein [Streptosporangium canum]|uniref:hypothetical protein n=1 Tax=Streptosporangium canum TaxID=324952 RepID=UPI0033A443A3